MDLVNSLSCDIKYRDFSRLRRVIAAVGYSKRRHILEIEFVNGAVYRYVDVPAAVYRDLMSAESTARFYDSNIRKHYRSVVVRPRHREQTEN